MLGLLAVAGLALSLAFFTVSTDLGRGLLVPRLVSLADDALAGRVELRGFHLLAKGGIELLGGRVIDPDGDVVLTVERARVYLDVARLRFRTVGLVVEVDGPAVVLKREDDGTLSLTRAFAPARPAAPKAPSGPFEWTVRLTRLAVRDGSVRYVDAEGAVPFAAEKLALDGRAAFGPAGGRAELSLRGELFAPERAPLALGLQASLRDRSVRVRFLRASVGDTALELAGELDTATWKGRAAVLALAVDARAVREVAPDTPIAGDLAGTLYAESDGASATAALDLAPKGGGGSGQAAAAVWLPPGALSGGAEVRLAGLDLSRLLRGAPVTALTLEARGRAAGKDLASLRGGLSLSLARSRLGAGRVDAVEARLTADRGTFELERLDASLPGATLTARGRWRRGAEVAGQVSAAGTDLDAFRVNLARLLDRPLPAVTGKVKIGAVISGTEDAPRARVSLSAPALGLPGVSAAGLALVGSLAGPLATPSAEVSGTVGRLAASGLDVRSLQLGARLEGRAVEVSLTGAVPELGPDPILAQARGALSPSGEVFALEALTLAWPGARFALASPARVTLAGPSVDRLALADGLQRLTLAGGLSGQGRRRSLEARLQIEGLDLGRLPRTLVPPRLALVGRLGADLTAHGSPKAPTVAGRLELADGGVAGVTGISATADLGWDGARRRARVDLAARRVAGGELAVRGELPLPLARAEGPEPLALTAELKGVSVAEVLRMTDLPHADDVGGVAAVELQVTGTVRSPALTARATLSDGRWQELEGLGLVLELEDPGEQARLVARLEQGGARVAEGEVVVPLVLVALLRNPAEGARGLLEKRMKMLVTVPGLDLERLAGKAGVPEDVRGTVTAGAELGGTLRAPRGKLTAALADGALAGYIGLAASLEVEATDGATALTARVALAGEEIARLAGRLALSPELLGGAAARGGAALTAKLEIPKADLRRADAPVPVAGEVSGQVDVTGSLAAPLVDVHLSGRKLEVSGRPLGDVEAKGHAEARALHAELVLSVPMGGTLSGKLDAETGIGLVTLRRGDVLRAPARASLVANALDLGFLPAVAPGVVRSASGKLGMDLVAVGPLGRLQPRGTVALTRGKLAVAEFGEWSDLELSASLSDDVFRVDRFTGQAKKGQFDFQAEAKGLSRRGAPADVKAALRTNGLLVARAGEELATVSVNATLGGTFTRERLDAELRIARAEVRLPPKLSSRKIQPLGVREDIVVGPFQKPRPAGAGSQPSPQARPFEAKVRVVAPNQILVRGDNPRIDVEAKADVTGEWSDQVLGLDGVVETLRGDVEPLSARVFDLKRARVVFTGGEWKEGELEITAVWTNPTAVVTASITGTLGEPEVKLTSQPSLDETQIALLIATGSRTELKPGSGGVSPLSEAGGAALGAFSQQFVKEVLADKLPIDTISVDDKQLRAGKYLGPKLYLGYTRRFQARTEQGENLNEVRLEYQISPRWNFEARAGDSGTGGGSLIWSKDY